MMPAEDRKNGSRWDP
ncbi:hypothetical protein YPPY60_0676, partial [Yersinia pestis PY-60]